MAGHMTPHEQLEWLTQRQSESPFWAADEALIREQAVRITRMILANPHERVAVPLMRVGDGLGGMESSTLFFSSDDIRAGGYEQVLLVEEALRRAFADGRR